MSGAKSHAPARSIRHPGPPQAKRIASVEAHLRPLRLTLKRGVSMNEAVTRAFREHGFQGGYARLEGLVLDPLHYVLPAPSPDESHAAWYSETQTPAGPATVERADIIAGLRDGAPYIHCHGLWRLADGTRRMGHLLPFETVLAEDAQASAIGVANAVFDAADDGETHFKLFAPRPHRLAGEPAGERGFICAVRPNEDITAALEIACRRHGLSEASVHGIGSLVGAAFLDGRTVESYATEVLVRTGAVTASANGPQCSLDIALVDMDGKITEGWLVRRVNPVCVTFELAVISAAS
ncbi:PCC domain-containing protein [Nitratireductor sp. GCM10026969]|uniref:PCC domain-containing protein n=1 Tax=Nitratireductor sp. GCM10026969 TaxID=3252645 RepID=UPI00361B7716